MSERPSKVARTWKEALTAFALSALIVAASLESASAGNESDPEVTDPCGGGAFPHLDICAAWLQGLWEVEASEDGGLEYVFAGLETTIQLDGDVDPPQRTAQYRMAWSIGDCRYSWILQHTLEESDAQARQLNFYRNCLGTSSDLTVPVNLENLAVGPDRLSVRLMVDDALAPVADAFPVGQQLTEPQANTQLIFGTRPLGALTVEWDGTDPGRTFVVGQDRPTQ